MSCASASSMTMCRTLWAKFSGAHSGPYALPASSKRRSRAAGVDTTMSVGLRCGGGEREVITRALSSGDGWLRGSESSLSESVAEVATTCSQSSRFGQTMSAQC